MQRIMAFDRTDYNGGQHLPVADMQAVRLAAAP
jgi:hypothetical protein